MTTALTTTTGNTQLATLDPNIIANLVTTGVLSCLSPTDKVAYYNYRCQQAGLDPAAKPFDLLNLQGKQILYANATCTQQLCSVHNLTTTVVSRERVEDAYTVVVKVTAPDGRSTENIGAVTLTGLKGDGYANALMKAHTKAVRRTVLAHCGLGMLDETEVTTIPGATVGELAVTADPRGDLSQVDNTLRDKHVDGIKYVLDIDVDEFDKADMLREYVDENLKGFNDLYIAVAEELQSRKICTKVQFKKWLKIERPATQAEVF